MNKLFRRLKWRDIKSNFKQFLSVVVIVMLSVMLLSGFIVNSKTLKSTVDTYFEKTNLADVWLNVSNFADEDEQFFADQNLEYNGRLYVETNGKIRSVSLENSSKIYISDGKISSPYIESGKRGCLIDKKVAENLDVIVGIDTFNFELEIQGKTVELEFRITGTMSHVECADTYTSWPVFIAEDVFLEKLNYELVGTGIEFSKVPYNQVLVKTNNVKNTTQIVNNYYSLPETESELFAIQTRESVESVVLLNGEVSQSEKMIYVFPVIFLVVSVLVILTTIDQLVIQEKQRIGTLKSIGVADKKILRHYSSYGAWLCLVGVVLGVIFGVLIIPNIMFIKYNLVYSIPMDYAKTTIPYLLLIAMMVGIVLLGYLVSFFACFKILHKTPISCLKFDVNNSKRFKKSNGKIKKLPVSLKMAVRNIRLKPLRTVMVTIGIVGCMALLLCGFGIRNTLEHSVNNDFGGVFKFDVSTAYNSETFIQNLDTYENISVYEKYEQSYVSAKGKKTTATISFYHIEENSKLCSIKLIDNEVCVSKSVAEKLGIKRGDTFVVYDGKNQVELKLVKITETALYNGIFVANNQGIEGLSKTVGVWAKIKDGTKGSSVVKYLNSISGTTDAVLMADMKDSAYEKVSSIDVMTTTIKVFAILLAIVVLLNIVFLILKERTREIATLKVLGQGVWSIGLSVLYEVLFMTVIGCVIGMFFGYPLLVLVLSINKVEMFNFLYYLSPLSFVYSALIMAITIVVVWLLCVLRILKMNMVESLKSVE